MDELATGYGLVGLFPVSIDAVDDHARLGDFERQQEAVRSAGVFFPRRSAMSLSTSFAWARGAISVAYALPVSSPGIFARFARSSSMAGQGHYDLFRERVKGLASQLNRNFGVGRCEISVDGARVIDRVVALASGLGWAGKSTNILTKSHGSWVLLGSILTEAAPDDSMVRPPLNSRCGGCVACVQACPTGALGEAYRCDAGKCLSLITQSPREIEPDDAKKIAEVIYGCDRCQDVCPVNHRISGDAPAIAVDTSQQARALISEIADSSDEELRADFPHLYFPSKNVGLLRRNAEIALRNLPD